MSDQTPSQAEGERDDDQEAADRRGTSRGREDTPRSTPSQAEGEREEETGQDKS
ncbi:MULTISPECIES: hypothetical protein [Streptomyces]|uniref:Uncharacterized protein n=1 Tax=Streptomyces rimosus subsp. rimosus TaxID=132474 RepID=A0ABY3ZEG4_STRRM|nr:MULTISPECIES: hypothetical protein [Streptomyces]UNZ08230.1 hypothetical protein SRIMR7_39355 [Streptomyces rimosus subsp. rimosus]